MANKLKASNDSRKFLPKDDPMYMVSVSQQSSDLSSPALKSSFPVTSGKNVIQSATDANRILHYFVKCDVTKDPSGRKRNKMRKCKLCMEAGKHCDGDKTVPHVERATACATNAMQEIASMSTLSKAKELLGRAKKIGSLP
jgi:hypothetical protein